MKQLFSIFRDFNTISDFPVLLNWAFSSMDYTYLSSNIHYVWFRICLIIYEILTTVQVFSDVLGLPSVYQWAIFSMDVGACYLNFKIPYIEFPVKLLIVDPCTHNNEQFIGN